MARNSKIEWTQDTWNPVTGCSVVSPGCANCYAMVLAGTRLAHHPSRAGLTTMSNAGPVWNGKVRLNEDWLTQPLKWKRPRMIFVCAHGDLFHEAVPGEWIDRVFRVIKQSPQHTFQILTKRAARMRRYMSDPATPARVSFEARGEWPPRNAWLGVSTEDQPRADERVPELLATPAAVRFVSAEPLLGAIDFNKIDIAAWLRRYRPDSDIGLNAYDPDMRFPLLSPFEHFGSGASYPGLDWIIVGGESGPNARPMHPDWARNIRDQCAAAGVAYFHKQNGEWIDADEWCALCSADGMEWMNDSGKVIKPPLNFGDAALVGRVSGARPEHHSDGSTMLRVGKRRAGRLLDGRTHDAMPERRT